MIQRDKRRKERKRNEFWITKREKQEEQSKILTVEAPIGKFLRHVLAFLFPPETAKEGEEKKNP